MSKGKVRIVCGILPLPIGYVLNFMLMNINLPLFLVNMFCLLLWGFLSCKLADKEHNILIQIIQMNLAGMIMLTLGVIQVVGFGRFFSNIFGILPQMYFLPMLSIAFTIITPFVEIGTMGVTFLVEWIVMLVVSYIGIRKKIK